LLENASVITLEINCEGREKRNLTKEKVAKF